MNDEKYIYFEDIKEKKIVSRSANNKNKKGKGKFMFSHESLTNKEINKLNGKVFTYTMNKPMNWKEFRVMPDDLKIRYIRFLRNEFKATDPKIYEMFKVSYSTWWAESKRLGIAKEKKSSSKEFKDKDWNKWLLQEKENDSNNSVGLEDELSDEQIEIAKEEVKVHENNEDEVKNKNYVITGSLIINGNIDYLYKIMKNIVGDEELEIEIKWNKK